MTAEYSCSVELNMKLVLKYRGLISALATGSDPDQTTELQIEKETPTATLTTESIKTLSQFMRIL